VLAIISAAIVVQQLSGECPIKPNFATILKNEGPISIYAKGYSLITKNVLGSYGLFIAIIILNAFILTTLDTATRIARYLTEELFCIKNRYISTFCIVLAGGALAISGQWNKIWPAFGASNQLVASLALFVVTCWLLSKKRTIKYTLWPAIFMFVITVMALILEARKYLRQGDVFLFMVSIVLVVLAGFMVYDVIRALRRGYA
jgi:carbon starvation protein